MSENDFVVKPISPMILDRQNDVPKRMLFGTTTTAKRLDFYRNFLNSDFVYAADDDMALIGDVMDSLVKYSFRRVKALERQKKYVSSELYASIFFTMFASLFEARIEQHGELRKHVLRVLRKRGGG